MPAGEQGGHGGGVSDGDVSFRQEDVQLFLDPAMGVSGYGFSQGQGFQRGFSEGFRALSQGERDGTGGEDFPEVLAVASPREGMGKAGLPPEMIGYIYWPALLVLAFCSVLVAPVGARVAHRLPVKSLKRVFAFLLLGLAIYMANKAYQAFF